MFENNEFTYVVVGGGTAGSVVAARLCEDPTVRVLLVEAGAGEPVPAMADPSLWFTLMGTDADWADRSVTQEFTGRAVAMPRGRGLGGSSAINATAFVRGARADYDNWADAGAKGWGYEDLLPYFRRSENVTAVPGRDPQLRGADGPLRPAPADETHPLAVAGLRAAEESGYPVVSDRTSADIGFGVIDLTVIDGKRQSAADAYLRPARSRPNLRVVTDAVVDRLIMTGSRCTGVEFRTGGETRTAVAGREVVLCAGAIGTPKLLMLSGIGPREHLEQVGVSVVRDLPGVGANLHDHPMTTLLYRAATPITPATRSGHGEMCGTIRSNAELASPDVQILIQDVPVQEGHLEGPMPGEGYAIAVSLMTPFSRGTVRLTDSSPDSAPLIDPRYYQDGRDISAAVTGLRAAQRIGRAQALRDWCDAEVQPGAELDDEGWTAYLRSNLISYYHYAGTCKIGDDDLAVLDSDLRVHGIDGLRVADASVMPHPVGANLQATVYAIAERAVDLLRAAEPERE